MQETRHPGLSPGSGGSSRKEMATHSSTLAWKISWIEEPGWLQSKGPQSVGHGLVEWAYFNINTVIFNLTISSVQFSHSVVSESLWPHESQHARPSCPSPTPGVHSDSDPSSQWCHPAISSSVIPFSSCPQSLPASGSFPMSQLFAWSGQSIGVSALASVLPMNSQDWSLWS